MDPCMGALPDTPAWASPRNGQEQERVEKTGKKCCSWGEDYYWYNHSVKKEKSIHSLAAYGAPPPWIYHLQHISRYYSLKGEAEHQNN